MLITAEERTSAEPRRGGWRWVLLPAVILLLVPVALLVRPLDLSLPGHRLRLRGAWARPGDWFVTPRSGFYYFPKWDVRTVRIGPVVYVIRWD